MKSYSYKYHNDINSEKSSPIMLFLLFGAIISVIISLFSITHDGYRLLTLLPLSFIALIIINQKIFEEIPQNIGVTFLILLEFIRLVVSPAFIVLGGYSEAIVLNSQTNTSMAVLLIFYETLWISVALRVKTKKKVFEYEKTDNPLSTQKMYFCTLILLAITAISCIIAPEILHSYRSIAGVFTDTKYTSVATEQSYVVSKYATSTYKKLFLVLANYIIKVDLLFIPAFIMNTIYTKSKKQSLIVRLLVLLVAFVPLLFVGGAIGRSFIYVFMLIIIYIHLYELDIKKIYKPIIAAAIFVAVYFFERFKLSSNDISVFEYYSYKLTTYFQGINIVSGSFNLPSDLTNRFHYFIGDILRSIPFANTIFGLSSSDTIQNFFNIHNNTGGFIPTTIGQGYYYFSFLFAPLYSYLFSRIALKCGRLMNSINNPYYKLVFLYYSLASAMGVTMYSIEITLSTFVSVILPMHLIVNYSYRKKCEGN